MIRRTFLLLSIIGAAQPVVAQEQFLLRAGPISLDLPSTWQFKSVGGSIEGKGPNGELAIVSVQRMRADAPQEIRDRHMTTVRGFAQGHMPKLAAKNGEVIQPVKEDELSEGRIMFSAHTKTSRMFREGYFLQYLLASQSSMVYLTFEGSGSAAEAATYFSGIVGNHRWAE